MVKSDAWLFFKEGSNDSAVCKLCSDKSISKEKATVQRYGGTSHLWRHLDDNHNDDSVFFL